ncbi:Hypothetical protein NTJ_15787 [Nesidiocoris tenuis]|uniref:Dynein heavy chain tail domain-containing protein n=1 Tax=Nesidiocoris tenuis TaxID=355587 RepID=A0ABN7BIA5_9HEMI|nr:Hypothetical protein NTJ_15787 [Nesidiocoris tenuis]
MDFCENFTNNLYNFFTCLPEFVDRWDSTVEKALTEFKLVLSLAESYIDIKENKKLFVDLESKNPDLVQVQQKTLTKVLVNLEEAMARIRQNQNHLSSIVEDLVSKLDAIEKMGSKVPEIDSASKFYNIPRLNSLRRYAERATKFYQILYLQIDTAMSNIDYMDTFSIKDAQDTWDQKAGAHPRIQDILFLTTFAYTHNR